jgi:hypothetical protein
MFVFALDRLYKPADTVIIIIIIMQGKIKGYPVWGNPNLVEPFLKEDATPPAACPSIVNAKQLGRYYYVPLVNSYSLPS